MSLARRPYTRGEIVWLLEFACVSIVEDQDAADLNSHPVPVLEQGRPPGRFAEFRRHPARLLESRVSLRSRHREGQIGEVGSLAGEGDERLFGPNHNGEPEALHRLIERHLKRS
jgi:hypothetical protein